ncbi:hydrogen peroxide-inducible genes activator [Roseibium aggregatum]|uniref:LysR family transcriptional regulator n=1 Tax=Roseibium aggregatum TaxID=187304 RepID=A0A939E9H9_9HYPH|nr:hydrogen peroxide-inducible genes activator [Roseibium aggregatum]MBN9669065.1 LysR family transcriptional regulator [Roseibium aggregatum]
MITLRQLHFLVAVADTLNFSRAAEVCNVTQPTLSAGIKELEDRLGVQLVERTRRSVMLTALGEDVVNRGRALLLEAEAIEVLAAAHRNPGEGNLRLGAIPTVGPYLIPSALPLIRQHFPRLKLFLREEITESLIEGLTQGRLDLILIALPFETGSLEITKLFQDGYQLATPPRETPPVVAGPDGLATGDRLMLLERGHCLQRHALQAYPHRHLEQDESFSATSLTTLVSMVSEGLGITLLPNLAIDAGLASRGEVRLTPLPDACPRQIALAWRPKSARRDVFLKLAELLKKKRHGEKACTP